MSASATTRRPRQRAAALRWGVCAACVLALHAGMATLLLRSVAPLDVPAAPPEAVLLDLPPVEPAAPQPQPPQADPPAPEPMPPVVPDAAMVLPMPMPPPPVAPPRPKPSPPPRVVPRPRPATPPVAAPASAPPAAAPAPAAPAPVFTPASNPNAVPTWRGELIARLQRAKRYPDSARSRGDQGIAVVTFTMDRAGRILAASLVRSSGVPSLDEEAVALLHRAEPLPAMPPELPGESITLTVPVNFALR